MSQMDPKTIIELLDLKPLPQEGGLYVETYRSEESIPADRLPGRYTTERSFGTAIYYLMQPGMFSHLHRLLTDEVFHFYLGDLATMLQLHPDGTWEEVIMGPDLLGGQLPQVVVPRGVWQGTRLVDGGRWALIGTTMGPGFAWEDYEHGERGSLTKAYPKAAELIQRLTNE